MKVHGNSSFSIGTVIGVIVLIFFATSSEIYAQGNGTGGIPPVIEQLQTISVQLTDIQTRLTALEEANQSQTVQLTGLQDELVPCTLERYEAGQCGDNETPFDLAITLCASAGGEAKGEFKFSFASKTELRGGLGWKEVLDTDLIDEASVPGVLFAGPIPVILPSEVALGGGGSVGLGLDGCIEVGKISIGQFVPRERILTMLNKIASSRSELVALLVDTLDPPSQGIQTFDSQTATALDPSALVGAIQAAQNFAVADFQSENPFDVLSDPEVRAFGAALPFGGRLQRLFDDPGMMIPDLDPYNPMICERLQNASFIGEKVANICGILQNDLPSFQEVRDAFGLIDQINGNILDFPDTIEYIVSDVLPDVPTPSTPPLPSGRPFCQRFPRLCPFQ